MNAGDVKFKYQTDLPPEKQIVTCFPDVRQVRANILLIFSFFKKNMVKALQSYYSDDKLSLGKNEPHP